MVITSDNQKTNLGLSLKFEAKSLKVIGYSKKCGVLTGDVEVLLHIRPLKGAYLVFFWGGALDYS